MLQLLEGIYSKRGCSYSFKTVRQYIKTPNIYSFYEPSYTFFSIIRNNETYVITNRSNVVISQKQLLYSVYKENIYINKPFLL